MENLVRQAVVEHLVEHRVIARQLHSFVNRKNCTTNLLDTIKFLNQAKANKLSTRTLRKDRPSHLANSWAMSSTHVAT